MKSPVGVRVLAVFLMVGGLVGIGLAVWMVGLGMQQPVFAVFAVLIAAVFAFTCWQGLQLWKGTPGGYRWAKVLFAAAGARNMYRLIHFHFERHRIDRWSMLFMAGLALMAASFIGYAL